VSVALAGTEQDWWEHGERRVPADLTVARLRPHLFALGITRLARQTGLDRLGIPCFSAIRPAALTLSVSQGKGVDDFSAMASALMEAAEFAIAERPQAAVRRASLADLAHGGTAFADVRHLTAEDIDLHRPLGWFEGQRWPSGQPVMIPADALTIGDTPQDLPSISRSTNGLASGNTREEALFHAVCELLERDATSLWSLLDNNRRRATEFAPDFISEPELRTMCDAIADAGLELRLFDQTTDLGVPCVMAVIRERSMGDARMFDMAAGYGCHPVGSRAIARAITEAAQTRITNIAGGRDDFLPEEYFERVDDSTLFLVEPRIGDAGAPRWLKTGTPLPELLGHLADRVGPTANLCWAELGGAPYGISVIRALSNVLEDRETNINWVPGSRALRVLGR
jgi:YcaO-like protein with predicted kinase domain